MRGGEPPLLTREGVPLPSNSPPFPQRVLLKKLPNRQGSLSARQQKALPAYADSAFPYSYEYHLVPALALKDSFLHSLFYRAFHTVLCLFTNIRVALSCLTRKGSQSGPERHLVGNGLLYFGKSLREAATVSATAALLLCQPNRPKIPRIKKFAASRAITIKNPPPR